MVPGTCPLGRFGEKAGESRRRSTVAVCPLPGAWPSSPAAGGVSLPTVQMQEGQSLSRASQAAPREGRPGSRERRLRSAWGWGR